MGLLDTTMELAKIAGQIANPELVQEAMKANVEALALSRENLDLHRRITVLEDEIKELKRQQDITPRVYRLDGYVFVDGDPDAHCPVCWDANRKLIHIIFAVPGLACGTCKTRYLVTPTEAPSRDNPKSVPAY